MTQELSLLRTTFVTTKKEKEQLKREQVVWEAERKGMEGAQEQATLVREHDKKIIG